jgi:hypothetical protein
MRRAFSRSVFCILFVIVLLFTIGCLFIYWAVDNYVGNNFDSDRYSFSKIQINGNDTFMGWKFDKRTGAVEFCSKTNNSEEPVICYKPRHLKVNEDATKGLELDRGVDQVSEKQCNDIINDVLNEMDRRRAEETSSTKNAQTVQPVVVKPAEAEPAPKATSKPATRR